MHKRYLAILLAVLAVFAWGLLLLPQLNSVIIAAAIGSLTLPLYRYLRARSSMAVAISIYFAILTLAIVLPLLLIMILVTPQAVSGYQTILKWISSGLVLPDFIGSYKADILDFFHEIPWFEQVTTELSTYIKNFLSQLVTVLVSGSIGFAGTTVHLLFQLFLVIFMSGLAVIYAPTFYKLTCRITTLPVECVTRFSLAFDNAVRSIFLGIFFVAFIQGILTGIGMYIFGAKDTAFLTLLAICCAVVPIFGTALVWFPVATMLWMGGSTNAALGLVTWGVIIVAGADNFLRPYCLKTGINTSIIVLLFAILTSVIAFGPIGIILGPVLVAIGIQAVRESDYLMRLQEIDDEF